MRKAQYVHGSNSAGRYFFLFCGLIIRTLLIVMIFATIAVVCRIYPTIKLWFDDSMSIAAQSKPEDFCSGETSYVYDEEGTVLLKLKADKDTIYVEYKVLPDDIKNAFVAIEDKRFYQHKGVDWASTVNAAFLLVKNKGEVQRGGSTITQQLARNAYLSFTVSYERKIREIFLALGLEQRYSKEQILEFYINSINFGNGYFGIGAAAKGYFGKTVDKLSLSEIAFLCAIPNNPTFYNPRTNFDHTISRRNTILHEMYQQGYIGSKAYTTAVQDKICVKSEDNLEYGYKASYALNCTVKEFMKLARFKFEYKFATDADYSRYKEEYNQAYEEALYTLKTGGYSVTVSLNGSTQQIAQEALDSELSKFSADSGMQGALTVVDNSTGLVLASVGGSSSVEGTSLGLNRAYQSYKQPGSTIKPIVVYTPAIEYGYDANSRVEDNPIEDGPKNSDGKYSGMIPLRTAVEKSKNVVAWRLFEELTPEKGLSYAVNMHFSSLVPEDYTQSAALGGLTYGVTTEEMAGAYAALANHGYWREPTCITSIKDKDGKEIYEGSLGRGIYSKLAADSMTDVLKGVSTNGTARGLKLSNGAEFACKTGTTNENKTAWFCGYTKQYTVAVYVGADDNKCTVKDLWGGTYPARIWINTLNGLGGDAVSLLSDSEQKSVDNNKSSLDWIKPVEQPVEQPVKQPVEDTPVDVPAEVPVEDQQPEQPAEDQQPEQSVEDQQPSNQ